MTDRREVVPAGRTGTRGRPVRVVVVGAGIGGVGLAIGLRRDGHDVVVVDERDGVGGTWRAATYPGAACDVPSHLYSLSFAPKDDWSRVYAPQPEILDYVEQVVDDHGLRSRLRLGAAVTRATWHQHDCTWTVTLDDGSSLECDVLVPATGQLRRPLVPEVPGLASFPGRVVHTGAWSDDLEVDGRRIAVVGSGASAIQVLPPLAERAAHLTLFQRTPPWVLGRMDRALAPHERALLRHVPGVRRLYRAAIWCWKELSWLAFVDGSVANRLLRAVAEWRLRERVADPGLRERLRPGYAPGCKRILASDDWYEALQRPDVAVADGIVAVEGDEVVAADGTRAAVDAIVLATGYRATELLTPMAVVGRDGALLDDVWREGATAHLGITVHGFPNMFLLYGPNTNLAHSSIILMLESQMAYVRDAVGRLAAGEADSLEVRVDVQARFDREVRRRLRRLVWGTGCNSWYLGDRGRNTLNWPGTTAEYRWRTRRLRREQHVVGRRTAGPDPT